MPSLDVVMCKPVSAIAFAITIMFAVGCDSPAYIRVPIELRDASTGMPIANAAVDVTLVEIAGDANVGEQHAYQDETDAEGKLELQICGKSHILDFVNVSFEPVIASTTIQVDVPGLDQRELVTLSYETIYFTGTDDPHGFSTSVDAPESIEVIVGSYWTFPPSLVDESCPHY